jgi:hypothetical protein
MMAQTSGVLETCVCALGTYEPSCTGRPTRLFFMLEAHRKPQGMRWRHRNPPGREAGSGVVGHAALRSPPLEGGRTWSCMTHGALEPSPSGRRGLELRYTWRRWSPSYQGGGIRSHWTRGSLGAHLGWEAGSGAAGHVMERGCTPCSLS